MGLTLFQQCQSQQASVAAGNESNNQDLLLLCITNGLSAAYDLQQAKETRWNLVLAGALVFLMQLGFAMLCAGCVRRKNISNTLLKNLLDAAGAAIAWFSVGYAFAYGDDNNHDKNFTFVGHANFFLTGNVDMAYWFYGYTFCSASVTIIAGTLAERCLMTAYIAYSVFMSGFVYPVVAHSLWSAHGFLSQFAEVPLFGSGCIDFAGSGVVHLTGGATALVATIILGARKGRFYDSRGQELTKPREIPGHSIALQVMGVFVLWFGCEFLQQGSETS